MNGDVHLKIIIQYFALTLLVCFSGKTHAFDWTWGEAEFNKLSGPIETIKIRVTDVQSKIITVKDTVTGNAKDVADEFKIQVNLLKDKGVILKETAEQLLIFLDSHKDEYFEFAGDSRCGNNSLCDEFKQDLLNFMGDISDLSDKFPIIEKVGLNNQEFLPDIISKLPPILLFPMYRAMSKADDWKVIPENLANIFNEIGDPDIFSLELNSVSKSSSVSLLSTSATDRFCSNRLDDPSPLIDDPIRLNRIKVYISSLTTTLSYMGEVLPKDQSIDIFGEGGSIPIPNFLKMIVHVIKFAQGAVDTYRANIQICKDIRDKELAIEIEMENNIAHCVLMTDYLLDSGHAKVRDLVDREIQRFDDFGVDVDRSNDLMGIAERHWNKGHRNESYRSICKAYQQIGA